MTPRAGRDVEDLRELTREQADRLTEQILGALRTAAAAHEDVLRLLAEARATNVHDVLGYSSWAAYVQDKFAGVFAGAEKSAREQLVGDLTDMRLSTRSIAKLVGISQSTASRARQRARRHRPRESDDSEVTGAEVKTNGAARQAIESHAGETLDVLSAYARALDVLDEAIRRLEDLHTEPDIPELADLLEEMFTAVLRAGSARLAELATHLDALSAEKSPTGADKTQSES